LKDRIRSIIDELLPQEKVLRNLEALLQEAKGVVELDSGDVAVPSGATHTVILRRLQIGGSGFPFTDIMSAIVAVGGIERDDIASVPRICFCRLIYNHEGSFLTSDFMELTDL
jgi:hypothetical protein